MAQSPHENRLPLTSAQYGIWLGQQLDPASPAYWTAEALLLNGVLDEAVFTAALTQVVDETEALHMCYHSDGVAVWQSRLPSAGAGLLRHDFSTEADPLAAALHWLQQQMAVPADLAAGPLHGNYLLCLGPQRHVWCLCAHHIALDGFGHALFSQRVAQRYGALRAGTAMPEKQATLAAVVAEDQRYQAERAGKDRDFWLARMAGLPEPATIAVPKTLARSVRKQRGLLPAAAFERWQAAAALCSVDWPSWLASVVGLWLRKHSGRVAQTLGWPVMGRLGSVALGVPCMAMNIVPLPMQIDCGGTLDALAQQLAASLRAIRPHQRYRYEHLKNDLGLAGGRRRLFGPVLNLMPFERPLQFGDLAVENHPLAAGPVEDLSITIAPGQGGVRIDLEANPDAYPVALLNELHASLLHTLEAVLADPLAPIASLLPKVASDHALPLAVLQGEALNDVPRDVLERLIAQAAAAPQGLALQQAGVRISYAGLLSGVQQLAGQLHALGVGPGSRVALLLPREPRTIVALLAVLWVGAAYVPIDPASPAARIAMVLDDSRPALLLTLSEYARRLAWPGPGWSLDTQPAPQAAPLAVAVQVDDVAPAYVIYTSGSTGKPNGVMISRGALAHFVVSAGQRYGIDANDRVLQFAPLHFDASIEEVFLPLCNGGSLVLRTDAMLDSLPHFLAELARLRISVLDLPTAFWHELAFALDHGALALPACVRLVIIGGEAALAERISRWRSQVGPAARLLNTYGPTEATVICTTAELAGPDQLDWHGDAVPVGRPLPGVGCVVVDAHMQPVAQGSEGELCLLGPALALGYFEREALTAARFIQLNALPGAPRAYRTGDRVKLQADGQLYFLGRLDDEFKISGHRIDPAEVETALLGMAGVHEAAVIGQTLPAGLKRLVAFVVQAAGAELPGQAAMRRTLADLLPAPAIPAYYVSLARLPRNANGKIDRHALRALPAPAPSEQAAAMTATELRIAEVWQTVLGAHDIAPHDDFFALGGKSLQAIQVANRLSAALARELPVSWLFRHSTVAALAQALDAPTSHQPPATAGNEFAPLLTIQRGEGAGLFCIHPAEGLAWCYFGLARHLPDAAIHGLQARGLTGALPASFDDMVADYLQQIRQQQPQGPYQLLGWSSGGAVAHAIAAGLRAMGEQVDLLAILDSYPASAWIGRPQPTGRDALEALLDVTGDDALDADGQPLDEDAILARLCRPGSALAGFGSERIKQMSSVALHTMQLFRAAETPHFDGDMLLFRAAQRQPNAPDSGSWQPHVGGRVQVVDVDCTHSAMTRPAPLAHIGQELARCWPQEQA